MPPPVRHPLDPDPSPARLSGADAAALAHGLAGLIAAGLPLPEGLRALAEEVEPGPARRLRRGYARWPWAPLNPAARRELLLPETLRAMSDRLERGEPLDRVLADLGERLPGHLRGLIAAGARTGRMGEVFARFVSVYDVGDEIRRRTALGLVYPATLVACCLAIFVLVARIATQEFEKIFADFGVDLPALTYHMLVVSRAVSGIGWWMIGGPLLAGAMLWAMGRVLFGAAERRRMLNGLPLFGPLWWWTAVAEFCQFLALLVEAELPLGEALPLAGAAVRDADLAAASGRMAEEVAAGRPLSEAIVASRRFPRGLATFLRWGERSGSLVESLRLAGEIFEARARAQGRFVASFCAAIAVALILTWVAWFYLALFLPMARLLVALA